MAYEYIQRTYGVTPTVGGRVRHKVTNGYGRITKEDRGQSHYVQVRFEDKNFSLPCHPTELEYIIHDDRVAMAS